MTAWPPSSKQELQNRKILEELHQKKQLMLKQAPHGIVGPSNNAAVTGSQGSGPSILTENHSLSAAQRAALQHAHANSVACFITQDSSFGNLILPVLPRMEK